jgi:hypothetical protein
MTAEYELNLKDITAFYFYLLYKSPASGLWTKIKRNWGIGLVTVFVIIALIFVFAFREYGMGVVGIVFALVILLYYVVFRSQMVRSMVISSYKNQPNRLEGKHTLSITSESITDLNAMGESVTRWKDVSYLATDKKYLFILLREAEPYIVPRNAFKNDSDFDRFVELTQKYHNSSIKK